MDRETEIVAEITQNSGLSFVFREQNFPEPRFIFCANVSYVICKIWGYFRGKPAGEFTCIGRRISQAAGLIENPMFDLLVLSL